MPVDCNERLPRGLAEWYQHAPAGCELLGEQGRDGRRERAEIFVQLPSKEELPVYYEIISNPMDLRTVWRPPAHHPTCSAFG